MSSMPMLVPHTYALTYFAILLVCLGILVLTVFARYGLL